MPQLSTRVGTFTDSVIRRMTRISNQFDAVNLSQGFFKEDVNNLIRFHFAREDDTLREALRRLQRLAQYR